MGKICPEQIELKMQEEQLDAAGNKIEIKENLVISNEKKEKIN